MSTVSKYFITWVCFLYHHLSELQWSPKVEQVRRTLPQVFREKFSSTYAIVDATEVFIQQPSLPELQQRTFSSYKNHNTFKALIGISPSGTVMFVSKLYPGNISDKELTHQSGLLGLLEHGHSIMADRIRHYGGFCTLWSCKLNIPPFLCDKS